MVKKTPLKPFTIALRSKLSLNFVTFCMGRNLAGSVKLHHHDLAIQSRLGLDYIDLYLMHSPMGGKTLETWDAMIELQDQGLVRYMYTDYY